MAEGSIAERKKQQSTENFALFLRKGAAALNAKNNKLLARFGATPEAQNTALSKLSSEERDTLYANGRLLCLTGANLTEAHKHEEVDLSLSGANLSWADLSWANLSWADLTGANLSWADLTGTRGQSTIVPGVIFDVGTKIDTLAPRWMWDLWNAASVEGATHARWEAGRAVSGTVNNKGEFVPLATPHQEPAESTPSTQVAEASLLGGIQRGLELLDPSSGPGVTQAREAMAAAISAQEQARGEAKKQAQANFQKAKDGLVAAYAAGKREGRVQDQKSPLALAEHDISTIENARAAARIGEMGGAGKSAAR